MFGTIVRRTEINLVALRELAVVTDGKVDETESLKMRRYLLGLALVAGRCQAAYNLRQGCLLVLDEKAEVKTCQVLPSGKTKPFEWSFEGVVDFAMEAAVDFKAFVDAPHEEESPFQTKKVVDAINADEAKKVAKAAEKAAKAEKKAGEKARKDAEKVEKAAKKTAEA